VKSILPGAKGREVAKPRRQRWLLLFPLFLLLALWLSASAYLRVNQLRFVHQPDGYGGRTMLAPDSGLFVEATRVASEDSISLVTWVINPTDTSSADPTWILVCHGNAGNVSIPLRQEWTRALLREGVGVVAFDYRGYGASDDGPMGEEGLYRDARAVYDWMTSVRGIPASRIVIYGHSLGSGVATHLASRVEAAGLVLEGAFTSATDVGARRFPFLPVRLVTTERYASIARMDSIAMPKLLLHATDDRVIDFELGERLFAATPAPKEFVPLTGGHDRAFRADSATYFGALGKWLRTLRATDAESPPPA
jgi:pimeloyl-ACP methyl ester carboxylesterase